MKIVTLELYLRSSEKEITGAWWKDSWFIRHDNAPAHTATSNQKFLTKNKTPMVP